MTHIIPLLILAFAVSLDSFSVGFTYGLRKMVIPLKSIAMVALCSSAMLAAAMAFGSFLETMVSPVMAQRLGGVILLVLGTWILFQFFRPEKADTKIQEERVLKFEIKSLGIVIHILRKPMSADFDRSGTITGIEALMLGIALSLDAFGAGVGAAMLGYHPLLLAAAAGLMCFLFVFLGLRAGSAFSSIKWAQKCSVIPGIILICIGILKI